MKEEREKKGSKVYFNICKEDIIITSIIVFMLTLLYLSKDNEKERSEEILSFNGKTIGITSSIIGQRHGKNLRYYFYQDNKRYFSNIDVSFNYGAKDLKRYFNVVFDKKNPENSHIYLNEEIQPDSITLTKAGFKYGLVLCILYSRP